ncbi:hypothetical protein SAMN02983003_0604 [Devosia enhydra]|uniref:Uncharacterized protein n=1 Tax=Devosia enhydra TaxID=665118 RepID=A0A1K2HTR5_9HYPH|nr:hypothetical protein [Devosia enhydra]SFZ81631.1 hypothetical protein SAMN02983003_0604 [Devosia enhydra]
MATLKLTPQQAYDLLDAFGHHRNGWDVYRDEALARAGLPSLDAIRALAFSDDEPPCEDDPEGVHHVGCGCDL